MDGISTVRLGLLPYLCFIIFMSEKEPSKSSANSYLSQTGVSSESLSINDLREREFSGKSLTDEQKLALSNFDKFRIYELNKQADDISFHNRYRELQVMANLGNYEEFLKEKYSNL
jgi:hypothetical protein